MRIGAKLSWYPCPAARSYPKQSQDKHERATIILPPSLSSPTLSPPKRTICFPLALCLLDARFCCFVELLENDVRRLIINTSNLLSPQRSYFPLLPLVAPILRRKAQGPFRRAFLADNASFAIPHLSLPLPLDSGSMAVASRHPQLP